MILFMTCELSCITAFNGAHLVPTSSSGISHSALDRQVYIMLGMFRLSDQLLLNPDQLIRYLI